MENLAIEKNKIKIFIFDVLFDFHENLHSAQ